MFVGDVEIVQRIARVVCQCRSVYLKHGQRLTQKKKTKPVKLRRTGNCGSLNLFAMSLGHAIPLSTKRSLSNVNVSVSTEFQNCATAISEQQQVPLNMLQATRPQG
jgi:hypothetical protein